MFCPQCRAEYREGFAVCSECQVDLVADLPAIDDDKRPDMELVTVFDSTNPALIGIARNVLEGAGIEFLELGANAAGGVFAGNPFLGHVRFQVEEARVEEATALLSELAESDEPLEDEPPQSS